MVQPREAKDQTSLPARVQVIPVNGAQAAPRPSQLGVDNEEWGRLYQEFSTGKEVSLRLPPGVDIKIRVLAATNT